MGHIGESCTKEHHGVPSPPPWNMRCKNPNILHLSSDRCARATWAASVRPVAYRLRRASAEESWPTSSPIGGPPLGSPASGAKPECRGSVRWLRPPGTPLHPALHSAKCCGSSKGSRRPCPEAEDARHVVRSLRFAAAWWCLRRCSRRVRRL